VIYNILEWNSVESVNAKTTECRRCRYIGKVPLCILTKVITMCVSLMNLLVGIEFYQRTLSAAA
jgi:hypothetical protein